MALVSTGQISLSDINQEFGYPTNTPISLLLQDSGGTKQVYINNSWVNLNPCSTFQPNTITPHSISEWYNYDHNELCPTTTTTSTTTTTTIAPCVIITNFSYTINGIVDGNGFTLGGGVQDVNISVDSFTPSVGYGTPVQYEYILDGFSTGVISSSTKNFPSVAIGNRTLVIKVYNCDGLRVAKTIGFTVNEAVTTTTTTQPPITTTTTTTTGGGCINITDFTLYTPNSTYPNKMEIRINEPNGTPPFAYDITISKPSGTNERIIIPSTTGGAGGFFDGVCEDIGTWSIYVVATNCTTGFVTKQNVSTWIAPSLSTPTISVCKYFDGTFYATITATNFNSASTLKVYDADTNAYVGEMSSGTFTVLVTTGVDRYYIKSQLCSYISGQSNTVEVSLSIPNC